FCSNTTTTTSCYTLSLHDALPIYLDLADLVVLGQDGAGAEQAQGRRSGKCAEIHAFSCVVAAAAAARCAARLPGQGSVPPGAARDRKSTRLNSSHVKISYAVFCLK